MQKNVYVRFMKRPMDFFLSISALIILSPVLLTAAFLVKIKLGSPVIFKQERPGKDQKIFKLYKFRTMTNQCDCSGKLLPDSIRITEFGKFLRNTSLDELPQLWNIVMGDMSIVGPRPLLTNYLPYYTVNESRRHMVRPGLTGLAQISGRNYLNWDERLQKDIEYLENISLKLDIIIIFNTIRCIFLHNEVAEITDEIEGDLSEIRRSNIQIK